MNAHKIPEKVIAVIRICGVLEYKVTNYHNFARPNPEQIKNLKRLLNIDVVLLDEEEEKKEETAEPETETEEASE